MGTEPLIRIYGKEIKNMATDYTFSSELFFDELLRISSSIVWKNPTVALQNEDPDELVTVEQYILARQGRLTFSAVHRFAEDVLRSFKMTDVEIVNCMDDKYQIPENIRDKCVERQTEWQIENYVEMNNYYRMLNGLPDKEDTTFFYNTDYPDISDNVTPLHEMKSSSLRLLDANGYLSKIAKENPKKKYLQFLTDKKIDIYKARNSKEFAILWISESDSDNIVEDFMDTYNEARGMIMAIFYQKMMSTSNSQYTGFIGMMILFQTIMLMQKNFLGADITRDFYDVESLRLVYDSYDVPFYQNIPLEYHKRIVKNVNILLSHKGSTRVFYDLFDIFGFNNIAMYSFYMLKTRRLGNSGQPIIVKDEEGNLDRRQMYDINFAKVPLYGDPLIELRNPRNQVEYSEMISSDKYWINDKDLLDKIFNEEFNYMESKYIGMQLVSNMMQVIYETTYYMKLILDNREMLAATNIYNSALHSNMNIFDMIIYICALITKKYGFEGNIPKDPHEIGSVMGFNFKLDLEVVRRNIRENEYLCDDKRLFTLLETMDVSSLQSVKKVYTNLTALRNYLVKVMSETDNVEEYWAYYELHQSIMYSEYTEETFKKSTGDMATSFSDLLIDINPKLYNRYDSLEDVELNTEIVDMLYLAKNSCSSLKHIQYADSLNIDTIIEYLFKLLDFFKSAKADLTGYEVIYSLVSNADNIMKLMNYVDRIYDDYTSQPIYSIFDELTDMIAWIKDRMHLCDKYKLIDDLPYIFDSTVVKSVIKYLTDYIKECTEILYEIVDSTQFVDYINDHREITILKDDALTLGDQIFGVYEELKEVLKFHLFDEYAFFDTILSCIDNYTNHPLEDKIKWICKFAVIYETQRIGKSEYITTDEIKPSWSKLYFESEYTLIDEIIKIYKEHNQINVTITPDDVIKNLHVHMDLNDMEYGLRDVTPTVREIFLMLKEFRDNYYQYLDELTINFIHYYMDDESPLSDEIAVKEFVQFLESSSHYMLDYTQAHRDITFLESNLTMQEHLFMMFDDMLELANFKLYDRAPLFDDIVKIYQKYHSVTTKYKQDSSIDTVYMQSEISDVPFQFGEDSIQQEEDVIEILKDLKENHYTYLSELVGESFISYPKIHALIHDDISCREIFDSYHTMVPYLHDNVDRTIENGKVGASQVQWGEQLILVYEETFEDD